MLRADEGGQRMQFQKVLMEIAGFLRQGGYRFGVIGGFGLQAYGLARATADLDFVVEEGAKEALCGHLEALGYETLHRSSGYSNHLHPLPALGRVDFVYVDEQTASALLAMPGELMLPGAPAVPVPRPEHLIAMKVLAMKNDPSRTFRELADIQFLLGLPGVDEEEVRGYFQKHGLEERLEELKRAINSTRP